MSGRRVVVFDRTCDGPRLGGVALPGLTRTWEVGARLYAGLGRVDASYGAASWGEALAWLGAVEGPIAEIQFWGHGRWGQAFIGRQSLDVGALVSTHPLHAGLVAVRARLDGPGALWWFRTCETFGKRQGHEFARRWTRFFGCRAAGHTYVIGPWQSGLHSLAPGAEPTWSIDAGLGPDKAAPTALMAHPLAPNTITFLTGAIPAGM
jgi:hypothetical protein